MEFIMSSNNTKAHLEQIISVQMEILNTMQHILSLMAQQNDLLRRVNDQVTQKDTDTK